LAWLEQADLVPADALDAIRKRAKPGEIDRVAAQARSLREWFRTFVREHKGKPLKAADLADLEPLNRLLARDEGFGQLVAHRHGKTTALSFREHDAGDRRNRSSSRLAKHWRGCSPRKTSRT